MEATAITIELVAAELIEERTVIGLGMREGAREGKRVEIFIKAGVRG